MLAAQNGYANVVKLFLEFGVDPNPQSGFNRETPAWYGNPLTAAAENGHEDVVRLLADHGVDLEFTDIYRHPIISEDIQVEQPMCLATLNKHVPVIKLLLERGCNPHEYGSRGDSAVSHAASLDLDILKVFIEASPDLKLIEYDPNPLENAIEGGNIAVAEFLLKEEPRLLPSGLGAFQLFKFAADHSAELAKLILDRIDVEKAIRKGYRGECRHLVIGAASAGLEDLMKRLKEGGCLSQRDPDDELNHPLCSAIQKGQVGMVKLLLDYGADPNSRRMHPFEIIMECRPPYGEELSEIAKELLRRGSVLSDDLDASFSYEALRSFQTLELFQYLLEERLSRTFNKMEIDNILQNSVGRGEDAFELVMAHFKVELQPGREAHQDAMAEAAMDANAPILKRFLDAGFDVNSREGGDRVDDLWRLNLLALVATLQDVNEDRRAANLLLEHGADIEGVDEPGRASSLFMLVSMSDGYDELGISKGVRFLLDLGADPFFTSKDGESPLDVAVRLNELPIVKVLVEFFEKQGDAAFQKIKDSVVRAASKTHSEEISRLLWRYYWPRVYPCS
jgi:ankyrin repeat protein